MKKILVSCDCNGNFDILFPKISELHNKHNFDIVFLIGTVCTENSSEYFKVIKEKITFINFPLYFLDNSRFSTALEIVYPKGIELIPNFHYLGSSGIKTIKGLSIAYLSNESNNFEELLKEDKNIDILLTNKWPECLKENEKLKDNHIIDTLSYKCCPQYHIAAGGKEFYRKEPFASKKGHCTHFISVSPIIDGQLIGKYLFALQVTPLALKTENEEPKTENPFLCLFETQQTEELALQKKIFNTNNYKIAKEEISVDTWVLITGIVPEAKKADVYEFLERWGEITKLELQYKEAFCKFTNLKSIKQCIEDSGKFTLYNERIKCQAKERRYQNNECWFCVDNPEFDKSYVIYRGKYTYISLEKGPLREHHIQIIPYNHVPSLKKLDTSEAVECAFFIERMCKYFRSKLLTVIYYERCIHLNENVNHCIIHIIPVETKQNVVEIFKSINRDDKLYFKATNELKSDYYINLKINDDNFIKEIYRKEKVSSDFMRKILCEMFRQPRLLNWKDCVRTPEQLEKCKEEFKIILIEAGIENETSFDEKFEGTKKIKLQ